MRPTVEFFGIGRLVADITQVRHDACEPGVETCAPVAPHPEDSILVVLDMDGSALGEGLTLSIGTERKHVAALAAQLETVARQLREVSGAWKRVAVCRICGAHAFDADNPPPVGRCTQCASMAFDIVDAATELRSAASGCGCGVHDTTLDRVETALRVRQKVHESSGLSGVALGFRRAIDVLNAMRGARS